MCNDKLYIYKQRCQEYMIQQSNQDPKHKATHI